MLLEVGVLCGDDRVAQERRHLVVVDEQRAARWRIADDATVAREQARDRVGLVIVEGVIWEGRRQTRTARRRQRTEQRSRDEQRDKPGPDGRRARRRPLVCAGRLPDRPCRFSIAGASRFDAVAYIGGLRPGLSSQLTVFHLRFNNERMSKIIGMTWGPPTRWSPSWRRRARRHHHPEGSRLTPSVVAFTKTGEASWDRWPSARQGPIRRTPSSDQALHGGRFDEVSEEMKMVPYTVTAAGKRRAHQGARQAIPPPEISAMILQKLKQAAEEYLGQPVTRR